MYNKVIMIGRLTSTPELHKTNNDKSVARATIAVNRRYKDQNGEREADFINIVVWGKLAETLASYGSKGSLISVDGELRTRKFEKNGQTTILKKSASRSPFSIGKTKSSSRTSWSSWLVAPSMKTSVTG